MALVAESTSCKDYDQSYKFDVAGQYLLPNRPWLTLYGLRVRCANPGLKEQALIQKLLPYEIMYQLFSKLGPYGLGAASCVCRQWNILAQNPVFWYKACQEAFSDTSFEENMRMVKEYYCCSWKRMFLQRPHLRFDGIYVARNTYLRPGISDWVKQKPVHVVTYFRYLRFWPGGKFRYCTTPSTPQLMASFFSSPLHYKKKAKKPLTLMNGDYLFDEGCVSCNACYPTTPWISFQINLQLKSTVIGANNRLQVTRISTQYVNEADQDNNHDNIQNEENVHLRGVAAFVFLPWDKIDASLFNRPQDMDYNITGVLGTVNTI